VSHPDAAGDGPDDPALEPLEWDAETGVRPSARLAGFVLSVAALAAAFAYDRVAVPAGEPLVGDWVVSGLDWLVALSLVVLAFHLVVPLARRRRRTRRHWRRLRENRAAVASLAYLLVLFAVGLVGPAVVDRPGAATDPLAQPPVGVGVPLSTVGTCAGAVVDGVCRGTWAHPLGTTGGGADVFAWTVYGAAVAVKVVLVVGTLLAPLAVAVGTVAAYVGGRVDAALMRYVDLQQSLPPFFVYVFVQFVYGPSLLLLVVVFGFLNWGGVARLVRGEALQRRDEGYVLAARSAGVAPRTIVRRHLVPNVSTTLLTAVTLYMPTLVIAEATLSFLRLTGDARSWGQLIAVGAQSLSLYWWPVAVPAAALLATVVAFNVLGDALRDALDPRLRERG